MQTLMDVYNRATRALTERNFEAALTDFVWVLENPTINDPASEAIRRSYCFSSWAAMGNIYPPARAKMEVALASRIKLGESDLENKHLHMDIKAMKHALAFADSIAGDD